jgi:hypothetical protein
LFRRTGDDENGEWKKKKSEDDRNRNSVNAQRKFIKCGKYGRDF